QLRLEQGAEWTESGQDEYALSPNDRPQVSPSENIRWAVNEQETYITFHPDSIRSISLCVNNTPHHALPKPACKAVINQKHFLESIFFDTPFQPHAVPNGEITGTVTIIACPLAHEPNKLCDTRTFLVLNDDLIADTHTRTYYSVTKDFKTNWVGFE